MPASAMIAPARMASDRAASPRGLRKSRMLTTKAPAQITLIEKAMIDHRAVASGVETLKWLVVPATAAPTMIASSTARRMTVTVPTHQAMRRPRSSSPMSHAHVTL